ncbi:MAG: hypothetical protein RIC87_14335 [Kiloniellales bacterium]
MTSQHKGLPSDPKRRAVERQSARAGGVTRGGEPRRVKLLIWLLFLAWCFCFVWSFVDFAVTEAEGSSFVRGINRLGGFLAWQLATIVLAATLFGVGWMQPHGLSRSSRRLTRLPLILLAVAWVCVVIAGITFFLLDRMESTIR